MTVPGSGLDLITRFLQAKSFIDYELPQVRYSENKASKLHKHKGAEKWMNDGKYPKLPHEHNAGASGSMRYDYLASFPTWTSELLDGGAVMADETGSSTNSAFGFGPGASFIAGIAFAVMIMKLVDRKFNRQQGYQPIPEAALDGQ